MVPAKFREIKVKVLKEEKQRLGYTYAYISSCVGVPPDRLQDLLNEKDVFLTAEELKRFLDLFTFTADKVLEGRELDIYSKELERAYQWHKQTFHPQQEL